ncbi:HPP family protein [Thalassospira marina]|uniref:CBS domain-containing protein n=1 Tax=Thalassospira marina TaxID=2048283 RepID=A0ABM6QH87_9PROT|nr:HPP family protein [Thalassospira marina]AUG55977.1 hypothetical protein CSC3H3_23805 [Thalassospira marina]
MLGPAIPRADRKEAIRAGIGAFWGLGLAGFLSAVLLPADWGLYLIAPFGASSVLLFAVPNSPLAQPWSAIMGNVISAVIGVTLCYLVDNDTARISLAVGMAIGAMIMIRAVHPPGGAVAMVAAIQPDLITETGFRFVLAPVAAGTIFLVLAAILHARLTGRKYPYRQFDDPGPYRTADRPPIERTGLTEQELSQILQKYRQTLNLGVEDLSRLIGAAEVQIAAHHTGPVTARDIMSRNLVTVLPDSSLPFVADLFARHHFTTLPVVREDGRFVGIIFQIHLVRQFLKPAPHPQKAINIMSVSEPCVSETTPLSALLPLMAEGGYEAIPVTDNHKIIGIVTRTDIIGALASGIGQQAS